MGSVVVQL